MSAFVASKLPSPLELVKLPEDDLGMRSLRLTGREALWSDSDEGRAGAQRERETARRLAEQGHDPEKLAADIRSL